LERHTYPYDNSSTAANFGYPSNQRGSAIDVFQLGSRRRLDVDLPSPVAAAVAQVIHMRARGAPHEYERAAAIGPLNNRFEEVGANHLLDFSASDPGGQHRHGPAIGERQRRFGVPARYRRQFASHPQMMQIRRYDYFPSLTFPLEQPLEYVRV
jgi:hypothetical protein